MFTSLDTYWIALGLCIFFIAAAIATSILEGSRSRLVPIARSKLFQTYATLTGAALRSKMFQKYVTVTGVVLVGLILASFASFRWAPQSWRSPLVVIAFTVAGAFCGFLLHFPFDRLASRFTTRSHGEMAGHFIGLVGVLYAIVLGFVVVTAWEQFYRTEEISTNEQYDTYDLFNTVAFYGTGSEAAQSHEKVDQILVLIASYAGGVQEEWKLMNRDGRLYPKGTQFSPLKPDCSIQRSERNDPETSPVINDDDTMAKIRCQILRLQPNHLGDQAIYQSSLHLLTDLSDVRNNRLHRYNKPPLQPEMWTAFVLGGLILVGMLYLVEASSPAQRARAMAVGSIIGMMWALALIFNHPFNGSSPIDVRAWHYLENTFKCEEASTSGKLPAHTICTSSTSPRSSSGS
jgi:hypothetical protein